jgi:hypothetical protein
MMFSAMMTADKWNYFWYHITQDNEQKKARDAENSAQRWRQTMRWCFAGAIACFLLSSLLLALILTNSTAPGSR